MTDIVSKEKRSEMMSRIRGKDTNPEILVRKGLHGMGYRYRLHTKKLPGKPDLHLPKYNAVIEIRGCFWHGHMCKYSNYPKTRTEFWIEKISKNRTRDQNNERKILDLDIRLLIVWECFIRDIAYKKVDMAIDQIHEWIKSNSSYEELAGEK